LVGPGYAAADVPGEIHEFPTPDEDLGFTGERYVPAVGDQIQHEHYHRYLFALGFCKGKEVLDIACGEGYGAALLGTVASSVLGVDHEEETVFHAERNYASENVTFAIGRATSFPISSEAVDVVVCFETLEHVDDHDRVLAECARVLKPGGILILSTPDRDVYSAGGPHNEFHVREVNAEELERLVQEHFRYCAFGGQRSDSSSAISFSGSGGDAGLTSFERLSETRFQRGAGLVRPVYLLAVASQDPLPSLPSSLLLDRTYLPSLHSSYRGEPAPAWGEVALDAEALRRKHREDLPPLLRLPGEDDLPAAVADEVIVGEAKSWTGRVAPTRASDPLAYRPLISVLLPTYETPLDVLHAAVDSVLAQTYSNWELVIVDDGSSSGELHDALSQIEIRDDRIRVVRRPTNGGISAATNTALEAAAGEFVAMLDHDDELLADALLEVARRLDADPALDVVYTDQEYIDRDGTEDGLLLKPDWSPTLFWGVMFVGHLLVVRRTLAEAVGGFDPAFDNVQDFEFMLRLSERTERIAHVPRVLYRWRRLPGSVAFHGDEKTQIGELQAAAVTEHLQRIGVEASARPHPQLAHRAEIVPRARRLTPTISVVLGSAEIDGLKLTLDSLLAEKIPILEVAVRSEAQKEVVTAADLVAHDGEGGMRGEFLLSLEPGLVAEARGWFEDLLLYAALPRVAAVSALVLDPNGLVEQAGAILGDEEGWVPAMRGWDPASDGYAGSLSCAREVSAVYGSWSLIAQEKLSRLGGLAAGFADSRFGWLELSLRASSSGLHNIVTPRARVRRVSDDQGSAGATVVDRWLVRDRWATVLATDDPFHNPSFNTVAGGYGL
jgi:SAM-dependent methyltransferase